MTRISVLLAASAIPVGSTVTKRTGEKEYTLRSSVKVYGQNIEIKADPGTIFLIDTRTGDANAIPSSTVLMWTTTTERLWEWLAEQRQETPK